MSLFEKANITNNNPKDTKKSIRLAGRIDIFIIIALVILIVTPFVLYVSGKIETATNQVNLFISARCEELFGKEIMKSLLQEFEKKNPNIRIRIANAALIGNPDILVFDDGDFSALVAAGGLAELNSYTNYDSGTQQLAIPLVSFFNLLFYNINVLTAAGFDHPPKTREQFITYARRVSNGDFGASGAAISLNTDDRLALSRDIFSWIWASGGNFWQAGDKPSLNTRTAVSDITFLGNLNREGLLAPGIYETTGEQRLEQFAQGRIAMMIASTRAIPYLSARMRSSAFGITTIPDSGAGGKYSSGLSSIYAGISSNSEYPEEAWSFLVFLAENSSSLCAELKAVPGVVSNIIPGDYVSDDPVYSKAWDIFEASQIVDGFSGKPGAEQYKTIFMDELLIFFAGSRTAQDTVNIIQQRWDAVSP